jgi:hypothetical protein
LDPTPIATVERVVIAVIAAFVLVDHAVAAAQNFEAVRTAPGSAVADLAVIDDAVAACRARARGAAGVRCDVVVVVAIIAELTEVDGAIATPGGLAAGAASVRALVAVRCAIVAGFAGVDDAVPAARERAVFAARIWLVVSVVLAVVAGLATVHDAVTARGKDAVAPTSGAGSVAVVDAIVAAFGFAHHAVATRRRHTPPVHADEVLTASVAITLRAAHTLRVNVHAGRSGGDAAGFEAHEGIRAVVADAASQMGRIDGSAAIEAGHKAEAPQE